MATKHTRSPKSLLRKLTKKRLLKSSHFSKANLTVFGIIFAAIGGYIIYSSFAATATCTQTLAAGTSGSTIASTVNSASAGTVICLANGSYGSVTFSGISKTADVIIQSASGTGATINPSISGSTHLKFQYLTMNGMDMSGADRNLTFSFITFTAGVTVNVTGTTNTGILVDSSTFSNIDRAQNDYEARLHILDGYGMKISNNKFGPGGCSDGVRLDAPNIEVGPGNEFTGITQTCSATIHHVDPIQFYTGTNAYVHDNYFHGNDTCIMAPDGSTGETISGNIFDCPGYSALSMGTMKNATVVHNTTNSDFRIYEGNQNINSSGNIVRDNIIGGGMALNTGALTTEDYNIVAGGTGAHDITSGTATYVGGANPTTGAGWALTSTSKGKNAASDGTDIGTTYFGPYGPQSNASTGPQTNCFASPKVCGYPDPTLASGTGVVGPIDGSGNQLACNGSGMTASGSITSTTTNQVIQNLNVTGYIHVTSSGVQIKNVCVTQSGGGSACTNSTGPSSTVCFPLMIQSGSASISNSTIQGSDNHANSIIGIAATSGAGATLDHSNVHNCSECVWDGPWTITNSYVNANADSLNTAHAEDVYLSDSTLTATNNTLLNPVSSTAVIFGDTHSGSGGACDNNYQVTGNLMAGGGFMFYFCGNATGAGSAGSNFSNNRLARCITPPITFQSGPGGYACQGATGNSTGAGSDSNGYWPYGGYYGVTAQGAGSPNTQQYYTGTWSNNVWDDNCVTVTTADKLGSGGSVSANCPSGANGGSVTPPPPPPSSDSTPPTVSLTAPTAGSTVSGASVVLSANASDNVGVSSVQFKLDGSNVGSADTTSPYSVTWDSRTATNGSHTITAVAMDAAGNSTTSSPVSITTNNTTSCSTSSSTWANNSFASQTASFSFDFDATPSAAGIDTVTGLSNGAASGYPSLAVIVRFNSSGTIDAINDTGQTTGGNYTALSTITYSAGTSYHFHLSVNPTAHTYSATVTPAGSSAINLATNYGFRLEQASTSAFNNWAMYSLAGSESVCGATLNQSSGPKAGDINGDNSVNITDLSLLLSSYGQNTTQCVTNNAYKCDLSSPGDGVVNIFDLSILLSHYGS